MCASAAVWLWHLSAVSVFQTVEKKWLKNNLPYQNPVHLYSTQVHLLEVKKTRVHGIIARGSEV